MKRVLVTGGNGQLGQSLQRFAKGCKSIVVDFQDLPNLDITNQQQMESYFLNNEIDFCINCAAYTAVDLAEEKTDLAYKVNAQGPKIIAQLCEEYQATLIHISTDFVFDGKKVKPYLETDAPNPLGVYGASKLKGEQHVQAALEAHFIIRTSWLYSEYGSNFMKTMLKLSETNKELSVVSDQKGSPTYAGDLAEVLIKIVESSSVNYGLYHYSNTGTVSWSDFARQIFRQFGKKVNVKPISTKEYPTTARRPAFSVLSSDAIEDAFGVTLKSWKESLSRLN